MAPRQPIPVRKTAELGFTHEWVGESLERHENEPDLTYLDADTEVIVLEAPGDRDHARLSGSFGRRARPILPDKLDSCIIEPHTPYFKRQFRKTKLMQAKWPVGHTKEVLVRSGKPQGGCAGCKQAKRRYGWRNRNWSRYQDKLVGCKNHVKHEWEEHPHPDRGKVFAVFSTTKLHGLAPGTTIVAQLGGVWTRLWVHEYDWWNEQQLAIKLAQERDIEQAMKLKAQKALSNEGKRARHKKRRHLALPTWYARIMGDDDI